MSYRKPSTAVYQLLENAGGAANTTPDLEAVIIGPLYNVLDVDPADGKTLANTKSAEIKKWTDAATDPGITAFELPFNEDTSYPGQEVLPAEVQVYMTNVQVQTFEFDFDLKDNATKVDKARFEVSKSGSSFGDAGTNPLAALPGGHGDHVKPGDLVLASNLNGTYTSVVVAVEIDPSDSKVYVRIADPINYTDSVVSMVTTFKIYRTFSSLQVTDSASIDLTGVNALDPMVKLSVYAKPFPTANVNTDYVFRSPAETEGNDPISVHVGYRAVRKDTVSTIMTINGIDDQKGKLGEADDRNPLALGVNIALQNTNTPVRALAVESDDPTGYAKALDLLESERVYYMVPLTQDPVVAAAFTAQAKQLSTPEEAMWRMAVVNIKIPDSIEVVKPTEAAELTSDSGAWMLTKEESTFISDGVTPGDTIVFSGTGDTAIDGEHEVERVLNNQVLQVKGTLATNSDVDFTIRRDLTRRARAEAVAEISEGFGTNRTVHVQPDTVGVSVNGVIKWLPGYYLACGIAGMGAGFPVQQGFTNLGVVGISDLRNSNYYFSREELNLMAAKGTCLFVQDTQGGIPYCRHELTTDMSVLEYREILKVKNWDYLAYHYKDLIDPFIGSWNITDDTLVAMRQSVISSSERLMLQKLPKIGAPLMGYTIEQLEQNPNSKDSVLMRIRTAIVDPNNYTDISLVI